MEPLCFRLSLIWVLFCFCWLFLFLFSDRPEARFKSVSIASEFSGPITNCNADLPIASMLGRSVRIMCRLSALFPNLHGLDSGYVRFAQHSTAEVRSVQRGLERWHSTPSDLNDSDAVSNGELFATRLASPTQRTNSLQHNREYLIVCSTDIGSFRDGVHEGGV